MRVFDTSSIYIAVKNNCPDLLKGSVSIPLAKYELGNVIWKEINLKKSIEIAEGLKVLKVIGDILSKMKIVEPDYTETLILAAELRMNFYDASFLQTSIKQKAALITEDKQLRIKSGKLIQVCSFNEIVAQRGRNHN